MVLRPHRVIVAGGRDFEDYDYLAECLDKVRGAIPDGDIEIVSGRARGADRLGERYAGERGIPVKLFPADWNRHGKGAGHIRNGEMADYGTFLVAFWDGKSKGTKDMIQQAKDHGLDCAVFEYQVAVPAENNLDRFFE